MATTQRTAADACRDARADITNLTDHLRELLEVTAREAGADDWAQAGSLGHVRELLARAVSFYSGLGTEDLEAVLSEIRKS